MNLKMAMMAPMLKASLFFSLAAALVLLPTIGAFTLHHQVGHSTKTRCYAKSDSPNPDSNGCQNDSRRAILGKTIASVVAATTTAATTLGPSSRAVAAVTDETNRFADTWWNPNSSQPNAVPQGRGSTGSDSTIPSDEVEIKITKEEILQNKGLGIELSEIEFRTNIRVYVKSVLPNSLAEKVGVRKDWIVVSVNGESAERTNAEGATMMISKVIKDAGPDDILTLRFRDNNYFKERLQTPGGLEPNQPVTTQVAPSGDTTQRNANGSVKLGSSVTSQTDQVVSVEQLIPPKMCNRPAVTDDLLEISYLGTVVETGAVFDGSAIKINGQAIPGRADDVSLYFVLGKQSFGQFPPGWDVGVQGMCVGERRRVLIPPVLAYGSAGVPRRGIPPDATLQYDITLVSINGLSTPQ